jgi:hypothetical protein
MTRTLNQKQLVVLRDLCGALTADPNDLPSSRLTTENE